MVHTHAHTLTYALTHRCTSTHTHTKVHVHTYTCTWVCIHTHTRVHIHTGRKKRQERKEHTEEHTAHSLQRQVSDSLAESWIARCSVAVILQLLCFSCSHNDIALGAWRDRVSKLLQLPGGLHTPWRLPPLPTPQDLGAWYADTHTVLQS